MTEQEQAQLAAKEAKEAKVYKKPPLPNVVEQKDTRAPDSFKTVSHHYIGESKVYKGKELMSIVSPEIAALYKRKMKKASELKKDCPIKKVG